MGTYRTAVTERNRLAQEARRREMRAEAERLAATVAARFPLRRLYLYGSVAEGRRLAAWSDIDLAVEGLPADRFFELAGALSRAATFDVDLKPMEAMGAAQRLRIANTGVLLDERI